jgi:hypothetical protein
MRKLLAALALLLLAEGQATAQTTVVVASCPPTLNDPYHLGTHPPLSIDRNGVLCSSATITGTAVTQGTSPWVVSGGAGALASEATQAAGNATLTSILAALSGGLPSSVTITGTLPAFAATPTFNLGTLGGAATAANQAAGNASLASILSALGSPLQAGGSVSVSNFPATQAVTQGTSPWVVSGSVTANAGTNLNTSALALEAGNLATIVSQLGAVAASPAANTIGDRLKTINTTLGTPMQASGGSVGISGTLPAFASTPTVNLGTIGGAATAANQATIITALGSPLQAGGNVAVTNFPASQAVTGPLTDAQLRASNFGVNATLTAETTKVIGTVNQGTSPWVVSAASLPLPSGAATETTLSALNTKINTEITADYDTGAGTQTMKLVGIALPASGGAVAGGTATNPVQISLANTAANSTAVKVDGSAVTQPVSNAGTFATQATLAAETTKVIGTVNVAAAQTIAVTNAGTFATQSTLAAETTKVIGTVNQGTSPWVTSGTVTANAGTNLNTSALALESGGNLASLVTQLGAVTASPTANTISDRLKTINTTLNAPMQNSGGSVSLSGTLPAFASPPAVTATLGAETTKVIGTVNQGTSPWVVSGTVQPGNTPNTTPWLFTDIPSSAAAAAITPAATQSAASNSVLCAAACNLYDFTITIGATSGWVMLFDATALPSNGATGSSLKWCYRVNSDGTAGGMDKTWKKPLRLATGLVAGFSTTACNTLTASATAFFYGQVQ